MKGRSKAGGKSVKVGRRKAMSVKRSRIAKAIPGRHLASTGKETEIAHFSRELKETREQQAATADVFRVISRSAFDLPAVLETLVESAARLCDADHAWLFRRHGEVYRWAASYGHSTEEHDRLKEYMVTLAFSPGRGSATERAALEGRPVQIADVATEPDYGRHGVRRIADFRTALGIPLLREGVPIGVLTLTRSQQRIFTDKQIDLLITFADQAVIAIENTRLLNELRQRTDDLTESLEHQTATSEVLNVIRRSPMNAQPVFDAICESASRLCAGAFSVVWRYDGDLLHYAASHNFTPQVLDRLFKAYPKRPDHSLAAGRAILAGAIAHVPDMLADPAYGHEFALAGNWRASIAVPMLLNGKAIGAISVAKAEAEPFSARQQELLTTFADQAVIAIENARLFQAEQQRTRELWESLEQQTATSEVLRVISSSPGELEPVFQAMLDNATRLCEAKFGHFYRWDGNAFNLVAIRNTPPALAEERQRSPLRPTLDEPLGRMMAGKKVIHVADAAAEPGYSVRRDPAIVTAVELGGIRTLLAVPMLKENELVGALTIYRQEVKPFTDKQVELVNSFAAQAVIAIENTRLLSELRESLQQQTATADVLKVISRATFDLKTVLDTLLTSAARLCQADHSFIFLREHNHYRCVSGSGDIPQWVDYLKQQMIAPGRGTVAARAALEGRTIHIPDVLADPEYTFHEAQKRGQYRTALGVPLMREGAPIGVMVLTRPTVRPFDDSDIALITTFADQAVIAIENVRLFEAEQQRTQELAKSLEDLRTAQDRLVQTQKLASLGQLTAGIAHEIKNPLNFVNNFSGLSVELLDELQEAVETGTFDHKRRSEIVELTDTLRGNLDKIAQHGKRADSIVKNMLLHSREGSGERRSVDVNALVEESLNLAYHGARAEKQGFNIALERSFDPAAGEVEAFPQEITRVLLNLIANGFYAATKRQGQEGDNELEATIMAATKSLGDRVEIRIRDNGVGMSPEVREKMFNPFFTTKPTGEGTGLGLSISHDIVVKQHGGTIEVDTTPGEFTEIRIILPRRAAYPAG
jgi:two-component system, NtrC family, sensor kinase